MHLSQLTGEGGGGGGGVSLNVLIRPHKANFLFHVCKCVSIFTVGQFY